MKYSDEEYIFRKDVIDKKVISRGARHKKNGSKSKKCTLPSDYLTRKEKMKMNSEVQSWNMNALYTYDEFKEMPNDIKIEYLQALTDKYYIGVTSVSSILFNRSRNALGQYLDEKGIKNKVKWKSVSGIRGKRYSEEFKKAVYEAFHSCENSKESENVEFIDDKSNSNVNDENKSNIIKADITCDGFDYETFNWLKHKYDGKKVLITIHVESL